MFEKVKNTVDIVAHIGAIVQLRPGGGRALMGKCPFHDDRGPSFAVYPDNGSWFCFGECSVGGTVIDFEMRVAALSPVDAAKSLCEQYSIVVSDVDMEHYRKAESVRRQKQDAAEVIPHNLGKNVNVFDWLAGRGFTPETLSKFGIGTDAGGTAAVVPIRDKYGRLCAFARRILNPGDGPKWVNDYEDEIYKKIQILFNMDQARRAVKKEERLILVESYFDVVALWEAGIHTGVAYCSARITKEQAQVIRESIDEHTSIVLAACNDDAAQKKLVDNRVSLSGACPGHHIRTIEIPEDCKDLNDVLVRHGREKLVEIVGRTMSLDTYVLERMLRTEPLQDIQYRKAREIYTMCENVLVQEDMVGRLAKHWTKDEAIVRGFLSGRAETASVMFKTIPHLIAEYEAYIRTSNENKVGSGWKSLDRVTRGFGRPGDVVQFISRTGIGKTMWGEQLMLNVGEYQPHIPVLFASLEQTGVMAFERFMMMEGRLEGSQVEKWFQPEDEENNGRLLDTIGKLSKKLENLVVIDQGGMTLQRLEQAVRQAGFLVFGRPVGLVVIDYLGYLKWEGKTKDQYELVSLIAREQKEMAKRLGCTVVSLHQITKAGKTGGEPVRGYMGRDSGAVEESADIEIGAWRPELAEGITEAEKHGLKGIWRSEVLKNRYGPSGVVIDYTFTAKYLRLDEVNDPVSGQSVGQAAGLPTTAGAPQEGEHASFT